MKRLLCFMSLFISVFCLIGCKESGLIKVRLAEVAHSIFYAPQYIAISEGYFEEEGLEIELFNANGADKVTAGLLSKDIDIGLQGPEPTVYLYNQKSENYLINFAQLTKRDGSFIMSRTNEEFTIENLKGKSILGGRAGGVPEMTLEYIIKKAGLTLKQNSFEMDVNVRTDIQFAAMSGAFISGEGDYTTLFEPTCTELELAGYGFVVASVGELSGEIPYTAYSVTNEFFENNKEILEKFTRAIYKAQQYIFSHTDIEVANVLSKTFNEIPLKNLEIIVNRYRVIDAWCETPFFGEDGYNKLLDVIELAGELENRVEFEKIVNNEIVEKVLKGKNR